MSISKFLNPKNDVAFKRIFGQDKNKDIVIDFLNAVLKFSGTAAIKEVTFLPTAQDPEVAAKKQSVVDVRCVDGKGRHYIVEMQVAASRGFEKRALYYAAKTYSQQLNRGEKYPQLKEIIFLAIADFVMFPDKKDYQSDHVILDKVTYEHDLKDFYFSFIELPKFKKTLGELKTPMEKWAYFFKHAEETSEEEVGNILGLDPAIGQAYEELNRFHWTEAELNYYEEIEKRDMDAIAIADFQREKAIALKKTEIALENKKIELGEKQAELGEKQAELVEKQAELVEKQVAIEKNVAQIEAKKNNYIEQGMQQREIAIAKILLLQDQSMTTIVEATGLSIEVLLALSEKI